MTDTTFIDKSTVIQADWLQDVNNLAYRGLIPAPTGLITFNLVVNSIANLRLQNKVFASRIFVTGYYLPGDGGGGAYWYDSTDVTTADNGGTIIVAADGGRWKLILVGPVSVKQFGAKLDYNGTTGTDDTTTIQACINWVQANT